MATLQKIRTRAGLLVAIVIGISLGAFILGDMLQSSSSILQRNQMEIGEVNGESIQYPDFQRQVEELGDIYKQNGQQNQLDENTWAQVREQTWQTNLRDVIMQDVYDDLGIEVSSDELFDMIQGNNLHPIIQQLFRDPNTGMVDRGAVVRFLKNLETGVSADQRAYWLYIEKQIAEDRAQTKYSGLVGKGLYVTSYDAKNSLEAKDKSVNFDYIGLNFSTVADSQVVVTESDLKTYFNNHKEDYKQQKTRKIEYITYPVKPSASDYKDAEGWINDIKSDFENTSDNAQFVNSNSDVNYDDTWFTKETLPANIGTWIYDEGAEVNAVLGPYFENESYVLAKVNAIEMMPDSVKARHILLSVNTQQEFAPMQALADSLKSAIEGGSDFATLARTFSTDQGSAIMGGDLGWFGRGQMVKPFEEAAFNNKKNEVTVVPSQFGIHIIQTTDRGKLSKQVQVAYLVRKVQPSTRTYQDTYAIASKFVGENTSGDDFQSAVTEQKLNKRVITVGENDRQIVGLENGRTLIRAAYDSEVGDIIKNSQGSPIFELGDNFVVAVLTQATEEGEAELADVKDRVELSVVKEKKSEYLINKAKTAMEGKTDLQVIAAELNSTVKNATNVNFGTFSIPGLGLEPAVIGTVTTLDVDKISAPIAGNNGVYIVKVTSVNNSGNDDVNAEQMRMAQTMKTRSASQAYQAHREVADVVDKRAKFY
ncbi:MAG: SurA N-terminal domain-containing protein [Draconibacterium sp.]